MTYDSGQVHAPAAVPPIPNQQEALWAPERGELDDTETDHNTLEGVEWIKLALMGTCYRF